jgi:hypothetical protein
MLSGAQWPFYHGSRSRSISVHLHPPIYRYRNEAVGLSVLELHDLVTIAGELAPAARLIGVLLDGFVVAVVHLEADTSQSPGAGAPHAEALATDFHIIAGQQLRSDGLEWVGVSGIGVLMRAVTPAGPSSPG